MRISGDQVHHVALRGTDTLIIMNHDELNFLRVEVTVQLFHGCQAPVYLYRTKKCGVSKGVILNEPQVQV